MRRILQNIFWKNQKIARIFRKKTSCNFSWIFMSIFHNIQPHLAQIWIQQSDHIHNSVYIHAYTFCRKKGVPFRIFRQKSFLKNIEIYIFDLHDTLINTRNSKGLIVEKLSTFCIWTSYTKHNRNIDTHSNTWNFYASRNWGTISKIFKKKTFKKHITLGTFSK